MTLRKFCPLRPLGERVLVKLETPEQVTPGGIVLPEVCEPPHLIGAIVEIGGEVKEKVERDDRVMFSRHVGQPIEIDDEEYLIVHQGDLWGVLK